jgi:hypothetical protein
MSPTLNSAALSGLATLVLGALPMLALLITGSSQLAGI